MEDGGEKKDDVTGGGGQPFPPSSLQPSKLRWVVCLLQCMSVGMHGFILQTYVAIWWLVSDTYGIAPEDVNFLALVYPIFFIPGSMISIYVYAKFGLGHCLIGAALMNFLALWIRCVGSFSYNAPTVVDVYGKFDGMYAAANTSALPYPITDQKAASNAFAVQLFGQIIGAISQPLLLNAPPRYQEQVLKTKQKANNHVAAISHYRLRCVLGQNRQRLVPQGRA